jgi:molecular chaperone HtpG
MERFLIEQKQLAATTAKILEINPKHAILRKLEQLLAEGKNDEATEDLVRILYDQACILEGEPIDDVGSFSKRLNNFIERAFIVH